MLLFSFHLSKINCCFNFLLCYSTVKQGKKASGKINISESRWEIQLKASAELGAGPKGLCLKDVCSEAHGERIAL